MLRRRIARVASGLFFCLTALLTATAGAAVDPPLEADRSAAAAGLRFGGTLTAGPGRAGQAPQAEVLVLDTVRDAPTFSVTGGFPRTVMGDPFSAADPGIPLQITRLDLFMVSTAAQTYTEGLCVQVRFWQDFDLDSTPVFSTPLGDGYELTVQGPVTLDADAYYIISAALTPPASFAELAGNGFAVRFQGDNGAGCAESNNLTAMVRFVAEPAQTAVAVGAIPLPPPRLGYYRNASGRADFNFDPADLRYLQGTNSNAVAIRMYAAAPEPPRSVFMPLLLRKSQ